MKNSSTNWDQHTALWDLDHATSHEQTNVAKEIKCIIGCIGDANMMTA